MKRTVLVLALLLGSPFGAHADTSIYDNTLKYPRNDAALSTDAQYCDQRVRPDNNGVATSAVYKKCMLSRGWRYRSTTRTPPQKTYDPETGLTCHDILGGLGSSCSNF